MDKGMVVRFVKSDTFHKIIVSIDSLVLRWYSGTAFLVQSKQWEHQHIVWNIFQVNNKDTRTTSMTCSFIVNFNRFHTLFWCFHCRLWRSKWFRTGIFSLASQQKTCCKLASSIFATYYNNTGYYNSLVIYIIILYKLRRVIPCRWFAIGLWITWGSKRKPQKNWKGLLESKEVKVNVKKTKMMVRIDKARKIWKERDFVEKL